MLAAVLVACAVLAAPALADPSVPTSLTATPRTDHRIDLAWSWPASPSYPDDLQIYRNGALIDTVDPTSLAYVDDSVPTPATSYTYQLVSVQNSLTYPGPTAAPATTRPDAAYPATNIAVTIASSTNIATVTWTRGAMDADVTYNVIAQKNGTGPVVGLKTVRYSSIGTAGSQTIDGLASFTTYRFTVNAVEDVDSANDDLGGTVSGASPQYTSQTTNDIIPPQFPGGASVTATRTSLGTVSATWSAASDAGSGVASYNVCVDVNCVSVAYDPLAGSTQSTVLTVPNDGQSHTISVTAIDASNNSSTPITTSLTMPLPVTPTIVLTSGGNGCAPLVATVTSSEAGTLGIAYHLFIGGVQNDSLIGQTITGTPYQPVTLAADATYKSDTSAMSAPLAANVFDPDGPDASPQVHGHADQSSGTETLSWDPLSTTGAPIVGYQITSTGSVTVPGYAGSGMLVDQSSAPSVQLGGLGQSVGYLVHVATVDACGRMSSPTADVSFRLDDNEPPSAPGLNQPTTSGADVHLTWTPSTDNVAVNDYKVYRDGQFVGRTNLTSFVDPNLPDAATFSYSVVADDTAGNFSASSATRSVTTRDTTPPTEPGAVKANVAGGTAVLSWSAATDNVGVAGYKITRGGTVIATVSGASTTTYIDKNLKAGTYEWTVQAIDAAGNVSLPRIATGISNGAPKATAASTLKLVSSNGVTAFRVGGKAGARVVLSFKLKEPFSPAILRLQVISGKARVRISLPAGSGRTTAGKRLGERNAKKGLLKIPLGSQKAGTLRLVVTAKGGLVTLSGMKGSKAPTIVPS